jgi:NAD(P)-dependent dehydrogenase (short-subunit alcohol dehydrogenase family)
MKLPDSPRAVVTGGGSGLGRALALALADRKGRILIADLNLEGAEETARLVRVRGGEAVAMVADVTKIEDVESMAAETERAFGGVDLLVNNAGVAVSGFVGEIPLDDWAWILRINLMGVVHGCHVFAPIFKAQKSGFILNVASNAGIASLPEMGPYNVSKAGVIALSETLYSELGAHGIGVSALCPTFFKTNLLDTMRSSTDARKKAQALFERSKITAEDVAKVALAGLEAERPIIIPQVDGNVVHALKRFSPRLYLRLLRLGQARGLTDKLV